MGKHQELTLTRTVRQTIALFMVCPLWACAGDRHADRDASTWSVDGGADASPAADGECGSLHDLDDWVGISTTEELAAMKCVRSVSGTITISGDEIMDLSPLGHLERAHGLRLTGLTRITSLHGLENLRELRVDGLLIESNPALKDLRGLDSLERVVGRLEVADNAELVTLDGLGAVRSVENPYPSQPLFWGQIVIRENPRLGSLAALVALVNVDSGFHVCGNQELTTLLPNPGAIQNVGLRLNVFYNPALSSETVQALHDALRVDRVKIAANGPAPYEPRIPCDYVGDGICDEAMYVSGDVIEHCDQLPCCALEGPTGLCTTGSDALDCPQTGGLPF
ncbi:MAG: hypothetical protein QM778_35030 [Myxococcales bacterium]